MPPSEKNSVPNSNPVPPEPTEATDERPEVRSVDIVQSGTARVQGDRVTIKQGGTITVDARQMELFQGAVVYARGDSLKMSASEAALVFARGPAEIEQSAAGAVLTTGAVKLNQSAAGVIVAPHVQTENSATVFLIAKNVSGQVRAVFGPRESLLFGLIAGVAGGIAFALTRWLVGDRRDKRKRRE